ncbi:MAG: TolB family protein [Chloroflexota bacterium]
MTSETRFDRRLPDVLEGLYLGPTPDYRNDVLAAATAQRQRPAWTFPGRWFPMADIATRPRFVPRVPWRAIGAAVIVIALLLALAVAYVGSRSTKLPAPFGPARNGEIVFAANGDIYAGDPVTGTSKAIVTGPEMDGNPRFSRDGTRVAFMRQVSGTTDSFDLVVANADGSDLSVVSPTHLDTDNPYEWSPDGSYLVVTDSEFQVSRFDASGKTTPSVLLANAYVQPGEFRPPDGGQILYEPQGTAGTVDGGHALWAMNADGTDKHALLVIPPEQARNGDFGRVSYSPDGTKIVFTKAPAGDTNQLRVFVMDSDGTDVRQVTTEAGTWNETDPVWSPDAKFIAFDRWRQDPASLTWEIQPLGIVSAAGGDVTSVGATPVSDGAWFDYSPDGRALISIPGTILGAPYPTANVQPTAIDTTTGKIRTLDWAVGSMLTWQRQAP